MIKGTGASEGICIGKIYKYNQIKLIVTKKTIVDTNAEVTLFKKALQKSEDELIQLKEKIEKNIDAKTADIFGAHIEIINDPELSGAVIAKVIEEHINSDFALKEVSDNLVSIFESMDNEYFRERSVDIKDVSKRILMHIQGIVASSLEDIDEEVIVVAKDITPSDTAQLNKELVKGFITIIGGRTSHSAIMARTLEIPAVVGAKIDFDQLQKGDKVILNGSTGDIIVNPSEEEITEYLKKIEAYKQEKALWKVYKDKKSLTKDSKYIEIGANIGNPEDLDSVIQNGGECIGLYRTEFLYMGKSDYPNEEEQYNAYMNVLKGMNGKPVVVRTLDIGGDKKLSYLKMDHEMNPFLGNRALRLCLNMPEIFRIQLRALLRASIHGDLHIMFPMIATVGELRKAKKFIANVKAELLEEGIKVSETIKIGIMIEIPAAAILANVFAKEVDFFSIGTNDLIQYTFAADRMNEKVSYLYQPFNPSLLRLLSIIIRAAHKEGKRVGMCGEMASEIKALPLLIGLGLDEYSMSASDMLRTRYLVSQIDSIKAEKLVVRALECESEEQVLKLVEVFLSQ